MKNPTKSQIISLVAILFCLPSAQGIEAITSTGPYPAPTGGRDLVGSNDIRGGWVDGGFAGTVGTSFNVGVSDLLVTSLGFYDGPNSSVANAAGAFGDGLLEEHQVGIYNSSGTLLASTTIPAGTSAALVGEFRYLTLPSPITLLAGQSYTIAGQIPTEQGANSDVWRNDGVNKVFTFGGGLTRDNSGDSAGNVPRAFSGPPINPLYLDGVFQSPNTVGAGYAAGSYQYTILPPPILLAITGVTRNNVGQIVIDFAGAPNTAYKITKSPNLTQSFVDLTRRLVAQTNENGVGQAIVPVDEANEPKEFYRVETL